MKTTFFLCLALFCAIDINAQTEVSAQPSTFINTQISGSLRTWTEPGNAAKSDDIHVLFGNINDAGGFTDYLVATNFGFSVPVGALITGIKVDVECSDPNARTSDYSVKIVQDGIICGLDKANNTPYPLTDSYMTYGGPFDLWGLTWDYKFNDDNTFGVAIAAGRNAADGVTAGQIDDIRITVYYNLSVLPVTLTRFSAAKLGTGIQLKWQTTDEMNMTRYTVERSTNGTYFQNLASVPSRNESLANYEMVDPNPLAGHSYYRLKMEGAGGYTKYSAVVPVVINRENVSLFPALWQTGSELHITNSKKEKLTVIFYNASGQMIGTSVTQTQLVQATSLYTRKGVVTYKVYDTKKYLVGSGKLMVQ